ncbi:hypothetical protein [Halopseudomonas sp.]|uniref:hypothetical protein n=1 Tax=Halopseudomonas sp. TaxID=2901191 RepID=UPI0030029A92
MSKVQEFKNGVESCLEALDSSIAPVLAQLVSHRYPPEVAGIEFEIFVDEFTQGFPVRAFFLDLNNTEFFLYSAGRAEYPSPVDPELLNIPCVYPQEFEDTFTDDDEDFDPWSHATKALIGWFSKKWHDAGGADFGLRATIAAHDSAQEFNLKTLTWQSRGNS